ncbi:MAG: serine/threonine-protein phosphatase [Anaeromicrobium sp.]|jgi:hypothetical protein|uniref:SpoIIE family protein phosphatase n=1 Tax=Anaeromicrobium sp. TaxID=1929132 RepID=UPI0025FF3EC0|nr:SpoIIE family protein phosphatase [Anaeromicrobium sp.]MCT4594532.1 serine/threonine-protein phosphatase [Anaeromicrobium sp.]
MKYFIDVSSNSLNKYEEELCGDKVEIIRNEDSVIIVVADGLGSGVKANILATLTSKIAATMLNEGISIEETVDTIINTLPECRVRKLAYATFTMIKIRDDGSVYIAEYDNPPFILVSGNKHLEVVKRKKELQGKTIKESDFKLSPKDTLTVVSDGVIHAGVGAYLNLGWQWDNVKDYLVNINLKEKSADGVGKNLIDVCENLYGGKPGDDTTVVSVKVKEPEIINMLIGPPQDKMKDKEVVYDWIRGEGKKIVCGGTAANVASRELNRKMKVSMDIIDHEVPPIAYIEGIDLTTEGVLTLNNALKRIEYYREKGELAFRKSFYNKKDGASMLAKILIEDCTHLNIWIGSAVNPAHQKSDFPINYSTKLKIINDMIKVMKKMGKVVTKKSI